MKTIVFLPRSEPAAWVPPAGRILAYLHGGRIFTDTLPVMAGASLIGLGFFFALWWIGYWAVLYRDYERWSLVGATLVQLAFLALVYLFGRIAWLRIEHLRSLRPGEDVALRSLPILLRMAAELFFLFAVTAALRTFGMPAASQPPVLEATGSAWAALGQSVPNPLSIMAIGTGMALWIGFLALFAVLFLYCLANVIETYLAIEKNTRSLVGRRERHDGIVEAAEM